MYFKLLFLLGIIECKKWMLIETEGHENQKGKSHIKKMKGHHQKPSKGLDYSAGPAASVGPAPAAASAGPLVDPLPPAASAGPAPAVDWKNECSLKPACSEDSCMIQKDIPGCGGSIKLLCAGGCLNIHKVRYTCRTKDSTPEPSIEQLDIVKKLCNKHDKCDKITPGRQLFGDTECPGVNDESMLMWIIYSCDGGEDKTTFDIPTCEADKTACDQSYACIAEKTCANAGGFCKCENDGSLPTCGVGVGVGVGVGIGVGVGVNIGFGGGPPKPPGGDSTKQAEELTCSGGEIISRDILLDKGHVDINCVGGCIHIHKALGGCKGDYPMVQAHADVLNEACEGKEKCLVMPQVGTLPGTFDVTCNQPEIDANLPPKLWLDWSCGKGTDASTCEDASAPGNTEICGTREPRKSTCDSAGEVQKLDIRMDKGFVNINCVGAGACIHIHKATAGCSSSDPMVPAHLDRMKELCEGKQTCLILVYGFGVTCTSATRKLWLQWSCGPGTDETTSCSWATGTAKIESHCSHLPRD